MPAAFRRPIPPWPIERFDVRHPAVPTDLEGLTILHVTDLHVRRPSGPRGVIARTAEALWHTPADLVVFTGDFMHRPGHEGAALDAVSRLVGACRARLGVFGVFGNHDSAEFERLSAGMGGIRWLRNESVELLDGRLRLIGASFPEDLVGASGMLGRERARDVEGERGADERGRAERGGVERGGAHPFEIAIAHHPTEVYGAAELGIPVLLVGHTHGGQWRLTRRFAPHTSCDFPPNRASGLLRLRSTLCAISRGLGEALVEMRFNCPRHVPLYTLRRGGLAGTGRDLEQVVAW